jgi:predicted DNA-binding protein
MCILHICDVLSCTGNVDHAARTENQEQPMRRLSIEVTPEQHQRLKAIAALSGKTIKEYVLERVLPPLPEGESWSEEEALHQLETFLKPRIEAAERGEVVPQTVTEIISELKQERHARKV